MKAVDLDVRITSFGHPCADGAPESSAHELVVWEYIASQLAEVRYELADGYVEIGADWSTVVENRRWNARMNTVPVDKLSEAFVTDPDPTPEDIPVPTRVTVNSSATHDGVVESILALHHLVNVYLLANIACPGSFYAMRIMVNAPDNVFTNEWQPSSHLFEDVLIEGIKRRWPATLFSDPDAIWTWMRAARIGVQQSSSSSVQASMYALLHAADSAPASPTAILWLAHALESLYQTPPALSRNLLKSRMTQLIGLPERGVQDFRSRFAAFYDARHGLVHSGMKLVHPIYKDAYWDDETGATHWRVSQLAGFAATILVASFQAMAHRGWADISFDEVLRGRTVLGDA